MNRDTFIYALEKELQSMPVKERNNILYDYDSHIAAAKSRGESEEEVIEQLGTPELIAKKYTVDKIVDLAEQEQSTRNVWKAMLALISLGFFNFIFVLGPFVAMIGVVIGLYAAAFGLTVGGAAASIAALLADWLPSYWFHPTPTLTMRAFIFVAGTGLAALGGLMGIGVTALTKVFYRLMLRYIRFNIKMIRGNRSY